MNYLAHLALSYPEEGLLCGNYLGDLIKKNEEETLHPIFEQGILFHRWIDTFSNNHNALEQINKEFYASVRKYAPVLTDIVCDYLLYKSWHLHYSIPYELFKNNCYVILRDHLSLMPARVMPTCQSMIEHDWLTQYQSLQGLEMVLKRTNKRTSFEVDLTHGLSVLESNIESFSSSFNFFYEDCRRQSINWLSLQNARKY